jgi:hypothetical protein
MYINPESFVIQDSKLISETLTKGGYVVQYWGEALGEIQVSGTTGSGGIEAVNILRAVYRNEITQFNNILLERAVFLEENFRTAVYDSSSATVGSGVTSILDDLTQGGFSGIVDGVSSAIEEITDAARGITEDNPSSVELIPTIGAFATSMILYWHGEKFTGYFKSFKVDEVSSSPGNFNYQFSFMITKRTGVRTNFMPWHRSPVDSSGNPVTASTPKEGARIDELSFITSTQQQLLRNQQNLETANISDSITSSFPETQESQNSDINRVSVNRNQSIRGN